MFGRERNRREKKIIITCLIQKKKKKENKNDETQLAIFQQQNRPLYTTEADVWGMLTEWNVIDPCRIRCYEFLCTNDQKKHQILVCLPHMGL